MIKIIALASLLLANLQLSFAAANNEILPHLNESYFQGFSINADNIQLRGYKYSISRRKEISFSTCDEALRYDISKIPEFEYFRFKLLLVSCHAVNLFNTATTSSHTFFPTSLTENNIKEFPALTTPYLSKTEHSQRKNRTIEFAHKQMNISSDSNQTKILTKDDEFYIHILARGDFNNDNIEDLLVSSEWFARHSFGKHTDLVILSKTDKDKPISVQWRLNKQK